MTNGAITGSSTTICATGVSIMKRKQRARVVILGMVSLFATMRQQSTDVDAFTGVSVPQPQHHHPRYQQRRTTVAPFSTTTSTTTTALNSVFSDLVHQVPDLTTHIPPFVDPLLLKHMATGGALAFAGDSIAQFLTSAGTKKTKQDTKTDNDQMISSQATPSWDQRRTAAMSVFGCMYTGGVQHFIFAFLNQNFDEPMIRLALAQFVFIPLCYYPAFLLVVPALRAGFGPGSEEQRNKLTTDVVSKLPSTLVRNWMFWLPVQFVQFSFVPPELQVTYCASFGVIWNAILSWSTMATSTSSVSSKESNNSNIGDGQEMTPSTNMEARTVGTSNTLEQRETVTTMSSSSSQSSSTYNRKNSPRRRTGRQGDLVAAPVTVGATADVSSTTRSGETLGGGTVLFSVARNNLVRTTGTLSDVTLSSRGSNENKEQYQEF